MTAFAVDPHRLEELLNYCVGFAKQMIERHGEFYPFGADLLSSGTLRAVGGYNGDEHPDGADICRLLQDAMKSRFLEGEIVAGAVAANVNMPALLQSPFSDGIRVLLECAGYSRFIYLPYRISKGEIDYGAFISVEVKPIICSGGHDA